ncbi:hypothetical protein LO762_13365 [Actinocorallia sp. API 0066]|uniref:hypothetical protein n=1 Tax=Actinocorallia sp. API 0066 TaxID=2896846 RepID=UPI001E5C86A5|nr:hypothetical protein [Actinocorallia sp. API 0066]MCD0450174.1 hypothetical protein [Actinocorallia sp. API 0066]
MHMSGEHDGGARTPVGTAELESLIRDLEERTARVTESLMTVAEDFARAPSEERAEAVRLAAETLLTPPTVPGP